MDSPFENSYTIIMYKSSLLRTGCRCFIKRKIITRQIDEKTTKMRRSRVSQWYLHVMVDDAGWFHNNVQRFLRFMSSPTSVETYDADSTAQFAYCENWTSTRRRRRKVRRAYVYEAHLSTTCLYINYIKTRSFYQIRQS